jgi:hypothetical protein
MRRPNRTRIDYVPGDAALAALRIARKRYPNYRTQALIDRLVICGLSALEWAHWTPPALFGRNRERWKLPPRLTDVPPDMK